jgi:hypothetical protein
MHKLVRIALRFITFTALFFLVVPINATSGWDMHRAYELKGTTRLRPLLTVLTR